VNIETLELPKFVEYEPRSESEQIETQLIEELKNCESMKLQSVAHIISEEPLDFDLGVAYEMLQDAVKMVESNVEFASTLFTRWLTMKSEQPIAKVSIEQKEFKHLLDSL
jgi:hypothetical protein